MVTNRTKQRDVDKVYYTYNIPIGPIDHEGNRANYLIYNDKDNQMRIYLSYMDSNESVIPAYPPTGVELEHAITSIVNAGTRAECSL